MPNDLQTIGDRLAFVRGLAGVSSNHLARLAGLPASSHLRLLERGGRRNVAAATVAKLATALGVTTDWLISGIGNEPEEASVKKAVAVAKKNSAS